MFNVSVRQPKVEYENEKQHEQYFRYNTNAHNHKKIDRSEQSVLFSEIINTTALKAIQNKDVHKVRKLLHDWRKFYTKFISKDTSSDFLKNIPTLKDGSTLLHEAVRAIRVDSDIGSFTSCSLEIVHTLVLAGANVNARNGFLETPLLIAIEGLFASAHPRMFRIHEKLISLLKDAGALVDIQTGENAYSLPLRTISALRKPPSAGDFKEQDCYHVLGATFYFGVTVIPRLLDSIAANDSTAASEALDSGEDASVQIFPSMLTALHLATWMGCSEIVELLLSVKGVDPCAADHFGLTPLVIAAALGHESCLAALLEAGAKPNQKVEAPNVAMIQRPSARVDYLINMPLPICQGTTALHEAVKSNNPKCVELLLNYGGDADARDWLGNTPLLLAGAILQNEGKDDEITRSASSYAKAYNRSSTSSVRKFSLTNYSATTSSEPVCLVNFPEENGTGTTQENEKVSDALVADYERIVSILSNRMNDVNHFNDVSASALLNAVSLGSETVSKMLLNKGADPSKKNGYSNTPIHEAASRGYVNLLKRFMDYVAHENPFSPEVSVRVINSKDANDSTPVHRAAYGGHRACASFMIKAGANLSLRNVHGYSGLELILLHVHRSRSFLTSLLDSQVTCKPAHKWEGDFVLELDFAVLSPEGDVRQTAVMNSLLSSSVLPKNMQRDILEHPLVEAFYRLKWLKARVSFFVVIAVHLIFAATLSAFVTLEYINYSKEWYLLKAANMIRYVHLLFAVLVLVNAIGPCLVHFDYYSRKFETWILVVSALSSILWAVAGLESSPQLLTVASSSSWGKILLSFILPLAWTALMLMIGRFRDWGSRALLFGVVLRNVLVTSFVLGLLIIGLSFSFFVLFHSTRPDEFGDPWKAFVNTVVMMAGEYNYSETFKGANFYDRLLFLVFVVVATLVIMNLVIALAVTDAQSLSTVGEWLCLKKKMEFSDALESIVPRIVARCVLPRKMKFMVDGSEDSGYMIKGSSLPSRVVDTLMDSALRYQMEKPSLAKAAGDVVITFPETEDCSLELHIVDAEENRVNEILRTLYSRVGSSVRELVMSSKALPNLGSKVFWVKRIARKSRIK